MPRVRKNKDSRARIEPFWKIGLYIRLSREDENEDESESVVNQEKILRDFVEEYFEPGTYVIVDVFPEACDIIEPTQRNRVFTRVSESWFYFFIS